jgi:heme/copper-type cytochrome/quinol oxidase subunit 4
MAQIDRAYVGFAIALLIVGELLGFYMGMTNDTKWRGVHIVIVLVGFVTIALFGALYRLWPAMKAGALASAQFWLTVAGVIGVIVGSIVQMQNGSVAILAISSALMIAGTLLLGWLFWERATA